VELYGCYWHKCKICGFGNGKQPKDVGRLKEYKKLGYSTLIVWEHELKDIDKLTHRLIEFNNK
jgi:G:T-mismatch repair DNA endonuclease (very short patch repair protein)